MKQWRILSLAMLLSAGLIFSGCSKDDDDPIIDAGPSMSLKSGEGYTDADFEVEDGSTVKFGVTANKSATHDNNLTRFNILFQNLTLVDTTFNSATFNGDFEIQFVGVGEGDLIFRIAAEGGMTDEKQLKVTVVDPPVLGVEVKRIPVVELGSWNDPIGSFFNMEDELVYTIAQAKQNQELVDFLFFRGANNLNTIASPDDEDAGTIDTFQLVEWDTKNQTRFNLTEMTADEFDEIDEMELFLFPDFDEENALTKANMLEVDQVVFFRTEAGKHGLIKVVDIYAKGDKIQIELVVEK
jgi:hypothetical protein